MDVMDTAESLAVISRNRGRLCLRWEHWSVSRFPLDLMHSTAHAQHEAASSASQRVAVSHRANDRRIETIENKFFIYLDSLLPGRIGEKCRRVLL